MRRHGIKKLIEHHQFILQNSIVIQKGKIAILRSMSNHLPSHGASLHNQGRSDHVTTCTQLYDTGMTPKTAVYDLSSDGLIRYPSECWRISSDMCGDVHQFVRAESTPRRR